MKPNVPDLRKSCLFCGPSNHGQARQVVLCSDNFYVFAGLGAIIEGYLIITPYSCTPSNRHSPAISNLALELLDELVFLRGIISAFYFETYGHPGLSFEHGRAGGCTQSILDTKHCHHPHLCCYPGVDKSETGFQHANGNEVHLWDNFSLPNQRACNGLHSTDAVAGNLPYLYIEHYYLPGQMDSSGLPRESRMYVVPDEKSLDSQFLRRQLSNLIQEDQAWDWAAHPTQDRVDNVIRDFSGWLREHRSEYAVEIVDRQTPSICFEESVGALTNQAYAKIADKFKTRWHGVLQYKTVGRFLSSIPSREIEETSRVIRVLDVGCGPGFYSKIFADLGFQCVAVDSSEKMLQEAENYVAGCVNGTVSLVRSGVEALPSVVLETFDAIWFSAVLLHIPRTLARKSLRLLSDLLAEGGVLYLSTRLMSTEDGREYPAVEIRREGRVFVYYQRDELEHLFEGARLQIVQSWTGTTTIGTCGEKHNKQWVHYLLVKG